MEYHQILAVILLVYTLYSVLFCLLICFFFFKYPFMRTMAGKLILYMCIFEVTSFVPSIITSVYYLVHRNTLDEENPIFCSILGFLLTFSDIFKNLIVLTISFFCFLEIWYVINPFKYEKFAYFTMFIISAFLATIPFYAYTDKKGYGNIDNVQCWIRSHGVALLVFYLPLVIIFILSCITMFLCLKKFRQNPNYQTNHLLKFFVFPFIMFISYILPLIRRFLQNYSNGEDDDKDDALVYIMYMFVQMHGVFNAISYVYINKFIRERLKYIILCESDELSFLDKEFYNPNSLVEYQ